MKGIKKEHQLRSKYLLMHVFHCKQHVLTFIMEHEGTQSKGTRFENGNAFRIYERIDFSLWLM